MDFAEKKKCSGCGACENICPLGAIKMIADNEGFLYPYLDELLCVKCGKCKNICPVGKTKKHLPLSTYAVKNKDDETRLASTSGAVFTAISEYVFENSGMVVGCKYDDNLQVIHDFATSMEEAKAFRGAKYTQSFLGDTFKKVEVFLLEGKLVLFTGTPCQVAGLSSYLGKDYENLIKCDLVCHSVPSPKALNAYIKEIEDKHSSKVKEFALREKKLSGWQASNVKAVLENGEVYREVLKNTAFLKGFMHGLYNRPSCSDCSYKDFHGASDITIGDYWGIESVNQEFSDTIGVSLVFVNNKKGEKLFNQIKDNLNFIETTTESAIPENRYIIHSSRVHKDRNVFFENADSENFSSLVERLLVKGETK